MTIDSRFRGTDPSSNLVSRLREFDWYGPPRKGADELLTQAADQIEAMATVGIRQEREIERLRERVKDLQQFHDWAEPQVHDHGRDVLEIERLRAALASIGEYDCPGGVSPKHCLGCAACDANKALEGLSVETSRDDVRDAVRYRWIRDWYHREGKRAEIDPYGHIAVRTLPEWEALLDAAIARSSPEEPSEQPPVETGLRTGELAQLRTIDAAARFYVDSVKPGTGLAWENLMNALFDGRPEKAK